jgi:hypothetical protein
MDIQKNCKGFPCKKSHHLSVLIVLNPTLSPFHPGICAVITSFIRCIESDTVAKV